MEIISGIFSAGTWFDVGELRNGAYRVKQGYRENNNKYF